MGITLDGRLVVAISSRALFNFEEENLVFEQGDDRAYMQLQLARLDQPAPPGVAPMIATGLSANGWSGAREAQSMAFFSGPGMLPLYSGEAISSASAGQTSRRSRCTAAFPLSDHADYPSLLKFVELVQPRRVFTLHGFAREFAATLRARGIEALALGHTNQLEFPLS